MNKKIKYAICTICILLGLILCLALKSIAGPIIMLLGALSILPSISGIIKQFWIEWNIRFIRILVPTLLISMGFLFALIEPVLYRIDKNIHKSNSKEVRINQKKKTPDEAMETANSAMWNYAEKLANESDFRLPIEVRNRNVYTKVMYHDEISIYVRYPFTYGKDSPVVHSLLFKIDYNGSILEVLDYH